MHGKLCGRTDADSSMYSALKVKGKKLYELAREGIEVERQPRPVTFYEIRILSMELPFVRFSVTCSKGTYIRTLCHDIGEKLGCMGCMESLLRTRVDRFDIQDSLKLSAIEEKKSRESWRKQLFQWKKCLQTILLFMRQKLLQKC